MQSSKIKYNEDFPHRQIIIPGLDDINHNDTTGDHGAGEDSSKNQETY